MIIKRYLNFEKFVYLLKEGLFCPKSSLFEDQWEGLIAPPLESLDSDDINNFAKAREWIYVSSWHMEPDESYAMWKIYGEHEFSVCVETSPTKIDVLFQNDNSGLASYSCKVEYHKPSNEFKFPTGTVLREHEASVKGLWKYATNHYIKHNAYAFEQEYRAIIIDNNFNLDLRNTLPGKTLKINPMEIIEAVIISPRAPDWFSNIVQDILIKYGVDVKVKKSKLELQ
jgi:hypothetical protein